MPSAGFQVSFPSWFCGALEFEAEAKGYLYDVEVVADGLRHRITFVDEYTLKHDGGFVSSEVEVVPAVTRAVVMARIAELVARNELKRWRIVGDVAPR